MFTEQPGAKELWQSTQKPHPQELTSLLAVKERISGVFEKIMTVAPLKSWLLSRRLRIWLSVICEKQNKFEIQLVHPSSFAVPLKEKLLEKLTRVCERLLSENLQQQFMKSQL